MKLRKRAGVSLVECLILIIIVAFSIGAMLQTSYSSTRLQMTGRRYVNSHKSAVSVFEALEAFDVASRGQSALDDVRALLSGAPDTQHIMFEKSVVSKDAINGVTTVSLVVADSDGMTRTIEKIFSNHSDRTVSDDRIQNGAGS